MAQENDATLQKVKAAIEQTREAFQKVNTAGLSFDSELEYALKKFEENPFLLSCSPDSIKNCLVNVALSGLSLSPILKYAYLVPRKIKKVYRCMVDPSYMGMVKILTDSGSVIGISATVVYEREVDSIQIKQGINGYANHKPSIGREKPGEAIACYSEAKLPDGTSHVELLRLWEWEDIERRSESVKSYRDKANKGEYAPVPTWVTDKAEMIRKTCIKKHWKYLPKTDRAEQVARVIDMDNQANGIDFNSPQPPQPEAKGKSVATPKAPPADTMATEEDYTTLLDRLDNPVLGENLVFGDKKINKESMRNAVTKNYGAGTLEKAKAQAYITALEKLIEVLAKDEPQQMKGGFE